MLIVLALAGLALIAHLVAHHRGAASGWHLVAKALDAAALSAMAILVHQHMKRRCR
jgi:hypothetical protein